MDWNRGYPLGSRVCTNPAFEQDGACPDIAHGQRHQRCLDAEIKEDCRHQPGDGSWWAKDAMGIELERVCEKCEDAKLAKYRPEILTGYDWSDVNERIEEDQ
jgi:hypothetical protein